MLEFTYTLTNAFRKMTSELDIERTQRHSCSSILLKTHKRKSNTRLYIKMINTVKTAQ